MTFDDGYRDNFEVAVPILYELKVPATFFISTRLVESPKVPWWDYVAYVIKKTQKRLFHLKRSSRDNDVPISIDFSKTSRDTAIKTIIQAILDKIIADESWFLEQLAETAAVAVEEPTLGHQLFMNWNQIRQLASTEIGLSIGSHAHSHNQLAKLESVERFELCSPSKFWKVISGMKFSHWRIPTDGQVRMITSPNQ